MKKSTLLFLIFNVQLVLGFAQNRTLDSLKLELAKADYDTTVAKVVVAIGNEFAYVNLDSAFRYAAKAELLLEKQPPVIQCSIYKLLGYLNSIKGRNDLALDYFLKRLKVAESNNLIKQKVGACLAIAQIFQNLKEQSKEFEFFERALAEAKKSKDLVLIDKVLDNGSAFYFNIQNYDKALALWNERVKYNPDFKKDAWYFAGIGDIFRNMKEYEQASTYYFKAIELALAKADSTSLAVLYNNYALIPKAKGDLKTTLEYFKKANEISRLIGDYDFENAMKVRISDVLTQMNDYRSALSYLNEAIRFNEKNKQEGELVELYYSKSNILYQLQEYKEAYEFKSKANDYKERISNSETQNKLAALQSSILEEKKNKEIEVINKEKEKERLFLLSVAIGLFLVMVFAVFLVRSLRIRNKQNKIIVAQKEEIQNSLKNLELLNGISSEITSTLNLEKVMSLIYKNVSSLMDVTFFIISTYDASEETVEIKYCVKEGVVVREDFKTSILTPDSFTAITINKKREILINDLEREYFKWLPGKPRLHGKEDVFTETMIFIPLIIKDKVIGLFSVQSSRKHAYTDANIAMLRSLSSVIAVALNNADSYNRLELAKMELSLQKQLVEEKQKEIIDSINYAQRIQQSQLPTEHYIQKSLKRLRR